MLRGRASVAYIDIKSARETQIRFNVEHNRLPAIFFIRKGKYYRYNVEMVHLVPQIDIEAIEKFIVQKEYEDIPDVFPEDYGDIPKQQSLWESLYEAMQIEIHNKGGIINVLMFKDNAGVVNL